jgi:hypothetical protein
MKKICIYQIHYDSASQGRLDPAFTALDNNANERPDWSELWPIRHRLLQGDLDAATYYGFLSPKFCEKTGWSAERLNEFIQDPAHGDVDAFVVPVFWDQVAYFRNVFEQGEFFHTGLFDVSRAFLERIGVVIDLSSLVMHSRNTAYCNFVIAKPPFWSRWLELAEALFDIAESADDPLGARLRSGTTHAGTVSYAFKVFLQERFASLLFTTEHWNLAVASVFDMPPLLSTLAIHKADLIVCDALKQTYVHTGNEVFDQEYRRRREQVTQRANGNGNSAGNS